MEVQRDLIKISLQTRKLVLSLPKAGIYKEFNSILRFGNNLFSSKIFGDLIS